MLWQLAELGYNTKLISDWRVGGRATRAERLCHDNRLAITGLYPTAHERHGREHLSLIAFQLIIGYLNSRPINIMVK